MRAVIVAATCAAFLALAGAVSAAGPPTDYLAPAGACPGSAPTGADAATQRRALVCLVNWARGRAGLARLTEHAALSRAAGAKAATIVSCNEFSHSPCGRSPTASVIASGYRYRSWAENLYWGRRGLETPRQAMRAWLLSAPHREHVLLASARDLGIGRVNAENFAGANGVTVWVLQVGRRL